MSSCDGLNDMHKPGECELCDDDRIAELERAARIILKAIGEDVNREGLRETPTRFARMWMEFAGFAAGNCSTVFDEAHSDQMIVVTGMRVWSLCEHHLLPFYCDLAIGYLSSGKILGLSKFARIAQKHAHKLQVQERLVDEIAAEIMLVTGSEDVAVYAKGEHLCMTMRGAKTEALMHSSKMTGKFLERGTGARAEFFALVNGAMHR